jgi:MFS family permease
MRLVLRLLAALAVATFISLILASSALWFGDNGVFESPEGRAAAFVVCAGVFFIWCPADDEPGSTFVMVLLIVGMPMVGLLAGILWALLVTAFGGSFSWEPAYYVMMAGLLLAMLGFLAIGAEMHKEEAAPAVPVARADGWLQRLSSFKVGGQAFGVGVNFEAQIDKGDPSTKMTMDGPKTEDRGPAAAVAPQGPN